MEPLIKSLLAVMRISSAMRSSAPDQLLGTVLEESLNAVDQAVLGWTCLSHDPPGNPSSATVTPSPKRSVYLAAVRHGRKAAPEAATVTCQDCRCLRSLTSADPVPKYRVIDDCPQLALSQVSADSHACVPLFVQDRPIGVLNLAKTRSASFSTIELLFLQTVAGQLSIALENARLLGETEARLKESQTLLEVSHSVNSTLELQEAVRRIARAVARVLSADSAGAYLLDNDGEQLRPFAGYHLPKDLLESFMRILIPVKGFRFVEEAFTAKAAVHTSNTEKDSRLDHPVFQAFAARSGLFVPMLAKDKIIGGLFAIWWEKEHQFTKEEVRLVDAIARQTAIAIENAKLFEEAQKHAQAAKASEEKYRLLAEHVRDVIYALDAEGRFTYVNPQVKEMLGYTPGELLGRYCTDILTRASQRRAQKIFVRAARGKDPLSLYELDMVKKDSSSLVSVEIGTLTVRDASGQVIGWHGIARDVTERKQLEQRLIQTERLRALGEMASGVAHDFNNVLGAILGRAQILRKAALDSHATRGLEAIEKAALDGANMVRRLQHFTRQRRDEEFFPVDLNQVVKDVLAITEAKWKDEVNLAGVTIDVTTSYGKVPPVMGNISELREVLTNIVFNAVQAMPRGGKLTLKTEETEGWVGVSVSDTGIGMSDDVKARIFEPFFTTKGAKGTGLGLSVSYGIIRGHRGEIDVQSVPGRGTTLLIRLPVPAELRSAPEPKSTPSAKPTHILIIEDDARVRELLSDILESAGHTVAQAAGGREGLRRFGQDAFDLVFTDLGMPECSGWEVTKAVKDIAPKTPVAVITGWGPTLDPKKLKEAGVDLVLSKPFEVVEVMRLVAEGLALRDKI